MQQSCWSHKTRNTGNISGDPLGNFRRIDSDMKLPPNVITFYIEILYSNGSRVLYTRSDLLYSSTVYLLKIWQDKNIYCHVLLKQIEIKLQISHRNAKLLNN